MYEDLSYYCRRFSATSVGGLKLLVYEAAVVILVLLLQARGVTLCDERVADRHRDTISDTGIAQVARCLRRSARTPPQIGNAAPTLPLHVLPVHWSVSHFLPFALSLVLSLVHTHNHTHTEVYIRPFEWDMILICITDIHPYIHAYSIHACMHVLHVNTHIHTHRDWRNPYSNGSYVTGICNQYLPRWCGTCWAQAVTSALSDRLKILAHPDGN